ncbi:hypothetical protein [Streptomyces sp. NPDC102282]|uniref:hypothetical protein n=1 Tax=Streptomyces sp. NPDC102282 TaxID=3366154 RepID=UPI0037FE60C6
MNMHAFDRNSLPDEPPIRRVFRDVIADCLADPRPPQAAMLFQSSVDPFWTDDRFFLGDFYNEILHQDTCQPGTADGVPLLAALAVDGRVPPQQRFKAIDLLFSTATVADRHLADFWPDSPRHEDPESEDRAREASPVLPTGPARPVGNRLSGSSAGTRGPRRGVPYCPHTARLDPTASGLRRTALTGHRHWRLRALHPGTGRQARALHLLGQMLNRVGTGLKRSHPGE